MDVAQGTLMKHMSECNSDVQLNKEWARSVLCHMGFTKRKANSKSKVVPKNFDEIKE